MSFLNNLKEVTNETVTENLAKAYKSTKSDILDLFSLGGAARTLDKAEIERKIVFALSEDKVLATKAVFYLADIRGGQGERRFFKIALPIVLDAWKEKQEALINLVPEFSRWDLVVDLYATGNKAAKAYLLPIIRHAMTSKVNKLIFKWLPTERRHGKNDPVARQLAKDLNLTPKEYRKMLTKNRKELNLVETNLTNKEYNNINYSQVPSKAGLKYKQAFYRHDENRYEAYLEAVISGKTNVKMNAATLYPHDIVHKYSTGWGFNVKDKDLTLEAAWKSLPNYLEDSDRNVIVVADTSGSMDFGISPNSNVTALHTSIALAVYFAERLNGEFKNHFITFDYEPVLQRLVGETLNSKLKSIREIHPSNTDLQATFDLILKTAVKNKTPQKDLPTDILIISDMQFDEATRDFTNFEDAKRKFEEAGYTLPNIIFWNVNARLRNVPATMDDNGVIMVSGYSPSVMKYILENESTTPYEFMLTVLNNPRYNIIEEVLK